jgi:cytochrome c553
MKLIAHLLFAAVAAASSSFAFAADAAAPAAHAAAPAAKVKPDLTKGEATYAAVCAACHGADGNSGTPAYPKLAQQHPEYLVKQLQEFKSDKRASPIMKGFASVLSDEDMRNVAYWVAAKKAKPGTAEFRLALRDALENVKELPAVHGVFNMSAKDHNGLDMSAFEMVRVVKGDWSLIK